MKQKVIFFAVIMMALAIPQSVKAYDFSYSYQGKTLFYTIIDSSQHQVSVVNPLTDNYYSYVTGDVVIPDSVFYGGTNYVVTSIGDCAFKNCGLASVTIGNSVTTVGEYAFSSCVNLISVSMGNAIARIGKYAFFSCDSLTTVVIGNSDSCRIEEFAFAWCISMDSIIIPNSVDSIGYGAFVYCTGVSYIELGDGLVSIGNRAFEHTNITTITISNSVNSIGEYAFGWCPSLSSITIPNSVKNLGKMAFISCTSLTSVIIGDSLTNIGTWTFRDCISLTSVTFGKMLTSIGTWAFDNCSALTEITSHATVAPTLVTQPFRYVPNTVQVNIPCGSLASYQSRWSCFSNFIDTVPFSIFVEVADSTMGLAHIETNPTCDFPAVIEADANHGYHFSAWSDGDTNNPRTITLTQDTIVTALFAKNQYTLTLQCNDETLGEVDGAGIFDYLDTAIITATATIHYHFHGWDDGNGENPRNIEMLGDSMITAYFVVDTHYVTVTVNDTVRGRVESIGTEFPYGASCTLIATAYPGYVFSKWSNGNTDSPYTFSVREDVEITAIFEEETGCQNGVASANIKVYTQDGGIIVDGMNGETIRVFDAVGRLLTPTTGTYTLGTHSTTTAKRRSPFLGTDSNGSISQYRIPVPASGVYLVKIGGQPARRVVVIR